MPRRLRQHESTHRSRLHRTLTRWPTIPRDPQLRTRPFDITARQSQCDTLDEALASLCEAVSLDRRARHTAVDAGLSQMYNTSMDEFCEECGKAISRRAKANLWRGEHVVCTPCLNELKSWELLDQNRVGYMGVDDAPWFVNDGLRQSGPFTTDQLIDLLSQRRVDFGWRVWREGMNDWKSMGLLFTNPALANDGQVRLRGIFDKPGRPRLL